MPELKGIYLQIDFILYSGLIINNYVGYIPEVVTQLYPHEYPQCVWQPVLQLT